MDVLTFLIYGLATWRLSSLLVDEAGPGDIFLHLRELAGITHDDEKIPVIIPDTFPAGVLSCLWCASMWVGLFWVIFDMLLPLVAVKCALALALSAVGIGVKKFI